MKAKYLRITAIVLAAGLMFGGAYIFEEGNSNYLTDIGKYLAEHNTPSEGQVSFPVFEVSFQDTDFEGEVLSQEEISDLLFDQDSDSSMTSFIDRASYGKMSVAGSCYFYQAKYDIKWYEYNDGFEMLAEEVLDAFDDQIDYSKFDSDGDGYMDCFTLNIAGSDDFWYGCQAVWYNDRKYELDGVKPYNYIINDAQPTKDNEQYYVSEMCHEFGHCMGLPDLYKYGVDDYENMKGIVGSAMMEDMTGDYCAYSKLTLGWLKTNNVKVVTEEDIEQGKTFRIGSFQETGDCILIPREYLKDENGSPDYFDMATGEYFIITYDTSSKNLSSAISKEDEGVRIIHAKANLNPLGDGTYEFKYNGNGENYDKTQKGIQIVRLVNDGGEYFKAGDQITDKMSGFAWYDKDQKLTVSPDIEISIQQIYNNCAEIKIE